MHNSSADGLPMLPVSGILGRVHHGLTGRLLMLLNFSVAISGSPHACFILVLILIFMFLGDYTYELGIFHLNRIDKY